ncbi:MAG: M48 family metallopeptidase [Planctomycetales bacterium]|nr:M48 family metallopeptidase [Planctomycetales bacterium]
MYGPSEFEGGVFSDEIDGGRASATIELSTSGMVALTSTGQRFGILYRDCQLDIGGASGRMVFCRTPDRKLTIFCEDRRFPAALDMESGGELAEQLSSVRGQRLSEGIRWRMWLLGMAIVSVLCLIGGYYALIAVAKASIVAVPVSVDTKIGKLALESLELEGTRVTDKVVVDAVQEMVSRLEPHSELKGLTFEVRVMDSPEVNAFCLPGGKMVVYTGLLKKAKTAEQVAGVLSHEMAHAIKRHGLQRITESLGIVVAIELMIGDVGGLVAIGVELGKSAALTSYSRELETEADIVGVQLLHAAAIDPLELAGFFEMLKDEGDDLPAAMRWLSTHPEHEARIATVRGALAKLGAQQYRPLAIDWDDVQQHLNPLKDDK